MFETIIRDLADRYALGNKAAPIVKTLLAYIVNNNTGGVAGFLDRLKSQGFESLAESWLGAGAAKPIWTTQVDQVFGEKGGLIDHLKSTVGLGPATLSTALAFVLPKLIGVLTPDGKIPATLAPEILAFIGDPRGLLGGLLGNSAAAAVPTAAPTPSPSSQAETVRLTEPVRWSEPTPVNPRATAPGALAAQDDDGGGFLRWLPWIVAAAMIPVAFTMCNRQSATQTPQPSATAPALSTPTAAPSVSPTRIAESLPKIADAPPEAPRAPKERPTKPLTTSPPAKPAAAAPAATARPVAKLYFDSGKTNLPADSSAQLKTVAAYIKAHAGAKAVIAGYHDPTGNKAKNAELAKNRAKKVRDALVAAGVAADAISMEKPSETAGGTGDNREARRVEVSVK